MTLSESHLAVSEPCRARRRGVVGLMSSACLLSGLALLNPVVAQSGPGQVDAGTPTVEEVLDAYAADIEIALRLSSPATAARAAAVEEARLELAAARRGLSASGTLAPAAELERDLIRGTQDWDVELDLTLTGVYRYDREQVLEAELALERAEARLRDQRRLDLRDALLALSASRLSALAVEDAALEAAEAAAELAEAAAEGASERELERLRIDAELATIDLERERLSYRDEDAAIAALQLTTFGSLAAGVQVRANASAWLASSPSHLLRFTDSAPRTAPHGELVRQLLLAEHELTLTPFEIARQLEVYGGYEVNGLEAGARLALEQGVPTTEATLGWQLGQDDRALTVGVSATFRLRDTSSAATTVAQRDVSDARAALTDFQATWPARERAQHSLTALAYREFGLEVEALGLARLELAERLAAGRDDESARNAVRRAQVASERAWQRYVRELNDYLDVIDVVLRFD